MDSQFLPTENQLNLPRQTVITRVKPVFIVVGILALGFVLGFLTGNFTSTQKKQENSPVLPEKPTVDESKLPISLSLLTNPIIYEWRGSVRGRLTQKDEHAFILVDDKGNNITITDQTTTGQFKTIFYDKISDKKQASSSITSLSAIPIDSELLGEFWVFKNDPNAAIGGIFFRQ